MNLAILSDNRWPTRLDFAGHGLGRSVARLGKALARRGHTVTVYAKGGSWVEGCTVVEDRGEGDDLAADLMQYGHCRWDAIIDSTHTFRLMHHAPDWPIVAKVCDLESEAPRNRVYGSSHHALQHNDPQGLVIPEGLDVDDVPFSEERRKRFLVWAALKVLWKQPEWAIQVAVQYRRPIVMLGDGAINNSVVSYYYPNLHPISLFYESDHDPRVLDFPALPPALFYDVLGRATALVSAVPSMGMLEAAAAGTPSIARDADEFIEPGLTGVVWRGGCEKLPTNRRQMRDWVAAMRSADGMARDFEIVCERAMKGERW